MNLRITIILALGISFFSGCTKSINNPDYELVRPEDTSELTFPEIVVSGGVPELFEWKFQNGPDFYIYRAISSNEKSGIGMYFGSHPFFHKPEKSEKRKGNLAGNSIVWLVTDEVENNEAKVIATTLFPYKHNEKSFEIFIHAWIYADSISEFEELAVCAESITFETITYEERQKMIEPVAGGDATR